MYYILCHVGTSTCSFDSRTDEVSRFKSLLRATCTDSDTSLLPFLIHTFEEVTQGKSHSIAIKPHHIITKLHNDKTTLRNGETTSHNGETASHNDKTTPRNGETTSYNHETTSHNNE